jgi:Leucine-rich repeat (LRR) protein
MKKIFLIFSLIHSIISIENAMENYDEISAKSWLISCKPCKDILTECMDCIGPNCLICINEVESSGCKTCSNDIASSSNATLNCDYKIEYQTLVCRIKCRMSLMHTNGECSQTTGECICTNKITETTTPPRITTLFPVHFNRALAQSWGFNLKERVVDLSLMNIGSIESNFLQDFTFLETLLLRNNKILRLYPNTFKNCRYLKYLDFGSNKISSITKEDFLGLEGSLETVKLNNNIINFIDPLTFKNHTKLTSYDFSMNDISHMFNIHLDVNGVLVFTRN